MLADILSQSGLGPSDRLVYLPLLENKDEMLLETDDLSGLLQSLGVDLIGHRIKLCKALRRARQGTEPVFHQGNFTNGCGYA
jgi:hypothetical protein